MNYRTEKDTLGDVRVPWDRFWGAQTQRSLDNFRIGPSASMPKPVIEAFGYLKKAAAVANCELGVLDCEKMNAIAMVCDEIIAGELDEHFPLVIWQTGSGTQTNMNVNEVIANRAHLLAGGSLGDGECLLKPNDDVNRSQSSNDTFPTAMNIAAYRAITMKTVPGLRHLRNELARQSESMKEIVKTGRTHLMDATPLTLGQEFSGYVSQIDHALAAITHSLHHLAELALGGTAVGTGLNAPQGYAEKAVAAIASMTRLPFVPAANRFESLAAHDAIVESHGALKQTAASLMKIANDIRLLASGPRCGIGELLLPPNEPGSSIMPGKVNPTQAEALSMVCAQVIGNDTVISIAGMQGHLELNVFGPVMIANMLQSAELLGDACTSFADNCVRGIEPNHERIRFHLENSLMLATALNPHIGYYKAAGIVQAAVKNDTTLREAALESGYVTAEEFDRWVDPSTMV
ncbi:MAG: class II fumarate hydratase [Chlorobiaceae bacterium]|nr:class II fumarate hydratase [Chlorobiaceae bacterium]